MLRSYKSEGIVLSRKNFSEADRILVIYSKYFGKIRVLAKGVRKLKSRKRSAVEVFSRMKFSVSRGKVFDILTETEIIDLYQNIRKDLKKASLAYYFSEVMDKITKEEEKNTQLYDGLIEKFEILERSNNLRKQKEEFVYDLLVNLGYWPNDKKMDNHDHLLESIIEKQIASRKIGKRILS